jgi:hypothetical protein
MAYRTETYARFLDRYQQLAGIVTMDATQTATAQQFFNRNMRKAWESYEWPWSLVMEARTPSSGIIAWEQSSETPIAEVFGVYTDNPFTASNWSPVSYTLTVDGIQLVGPNAPTGDVYVHYRSRVPLYTGAAYSGATSYAVGDQVYYATTGDFYIAIATTTGNAPTDATKWTRLTVPYDLFEYVTAASAGDILLANGQNDRGFAMRADAKELLFDAIEKYSRQQAYTLPRSPFKTHGSQSLTN